MDIEDRMDLVTRNTEEIVTEEELRELLETKENPVSYWGVAPTGPPHIGYYRTLAKQRDIVEAGFQHKILIADLHAYLDDMKAPWEEMERRAEVYEKCFKLLGLKGSNVEYVRGSDIQLSKEYHMETLKASALVTSNRAKRAASEVVRTESPKVSSLIYPIMQSLDCWLLDIDMAYSGIDNRHVYMLSRELLAKMDRDVPSFVFTPLGIGLSGGDKMDASTEAGRLELFASEEEIEEKIEGAFCPGGETEDNPILEYCKYLVFPRVDGMEVERSEEHGGDVTFETYEDLEEAFASGDLHPQDLKTTTAKYLKDILEPVREYFQDNPELLETFEGD